MFGGTGDLSMRKLLPALYRRRVAGFLSPKSRVLGVARSELSREDYLAQAAVMWLLSCVFVRFLEDNDLVAPPRLAGPGDSLRLARDLLPSTYGVEAFARTFGPHPDWARVLGDLAVCGAVGVISLAVATWAYRRAAVR